MLNENDNAFKEIRDALKPKDIDENFIRGLLNPLGCGVDRLIPKELIAIMRRGCKIFFDGRGAIDTVMLPAGTVVPTTIVTPFRIEYDYIESIKPGAIESCKGFTSKTINLQDELLNKVKQCNEEAAFKAQVEAEWIKHDEPVIECLRSTYVVMSFKKSVVDAIKEGYNAAEIKALVNMLLP